MWLTSDIISLNLMMINAIIVNKCEVVLSRVFGVLLYNMLEAGDVSCWSGGRGARRAGQGRRRQPTGPRQETAGEGIPARAQWRRRAAGGALAIDMPSLRSDGRCERFGALQRRMPLAPRAPHRRTAHHTCCVFIERHSRRRDAGMSTLPRASTSTYLCDVGTHAMFARTPPPPRPLPPGWRPTVYYLSQWT